MTPSELKEKHLAVAPDSKFFAYKTMRHWGDTMKNFGVCRVKVSKEIFIGGRRYNKYFDAFKLWRKKPVRGGLRTSHFFNADTFELLHGVSEI